MEGAGKVAIGCSEVGGRDEAVGWVGEGWGAGCGGDMGTSWWCDVVQSGEGGHAGTTVL